MASSRSDTNPNFNPIAGSGSSELLLSLRCDYPNKEAVIVVPGNTTFRGMPFSLLATQRQQTVLCSFTVNLIVDDFLGDRVSFVSPSRAGF